MSAHVDAVETVTEAPPATRRSVWRSRWLLPTLLVVGYAAQVAIRLYLCRPLYTPSAHTDEDGYLVVARALAGGPGGITNENQAVRRLGYPLMISPVYWVASDAFRVYRGVQLVNTLLNSLVFPLAFLFGRQVLGLRRNVALGAAFAAAVAPAVAYYAAFALTDAVLATIALGWLLLLHRWLTAATTRGRLLGAAGSGALAGLCYVVHVRGLMIVLVHVLFTLAVLVLRKAPHWRTAALSLVSLAAVVALDPLLKYATRDAITITGNSPTGHTLDAFTTLTGLQRMLLGADGQLWYLCAATLGLGAVGLAAAVAPLFDRAGLRRDLIDAGSTDTGSTDVATPAAGARLLVVWAALSSTLLIALSTSAALPPVDNRINYFAYPRYTHMLYPVWLLLGLATLLASNTAKQAVRWLAAGAAITLVTGGIVYLRQRGVHGPVFAAFDAPEITFLSWHWTWLRAGRPTALAVLVLAVIVFVLRGWPRVGWPRVGWPRVGVAIVVGALIVVGVANMLLVNERISRPRVNLQYGPATPKIVRDGYVREGDVVAFARQHQHTWFLRYNHMREVYWNRVEYFDQDQAAPPANATVVIAPWRPKDPAVHWDGGRYGFDLVVFDRGQAWAVWRRG